MRALFGPEASRPFEKVDEALRTFSAAAPTRYQSIRGERLELSDAAFRQELDAAVWGHPSAQDKIGPLLHAAISQMEDICVPIVQNDSPLSTLLRWWNARLAKVMRNFVRKLANGQ